MDHGAAGEVEAGKVSAAGIEQAAHAPHHVRHRAIDNQGPEREKYGHGAEFHPFGKGACD